MIRNMAILSQGGAFVFVFIVGIGTIFAGMVGVTCWERRWAITRGFDFFLWELHFCRENKIFIVIWVGSWNCSRSFHGLPFPRYHLTLKIQGQMSRSKVPQSAQHPVDQFPYCFTSGHPIDSCPFRSMTIAPPPPPPPHSRYTPWPWKFKVKDQGQRSWVP